MKNQALFSSKDKSKKLKCRLLQLLFGVLRVTVKYIGTCIFLVHLVLRKKWGTFIGQQNRTTMNC